MPRGKRKTYSEKLSELQEEIRVAEQRVKELKTQERELLKAQKDEELKQIAEIMEEHNLTAQELAGILGGQSVVA